MTALDLLPIEAGAFYVMDRGYTDFARLYRFTQGLAFFIVPAKRNLHCVRRTFRSVDRSTGLRSDNTIRLRGPKPLPATRSPSAESVTTLPISTGGLSSSATTSRCLPSPSPNSTAAVGKSNSSSSGSNNT